MHVSGSGPLGLLLMIAPLAAIPVFAIVGVPHFAPVAASGADDDEFAELAEAGPHVPVASAAISAPPRSANDLYAAVAEPPRSASAVASTDQDRLPKSTAPTGRSRGSGRWLPPSEASDQWEVRTDMAGPASAARKNDAADSSPGIIADDFDALEVPMDEIGNGQVSADEFNPDLLRADRASPSKNGNRQAIDTPRDTPAHRRPGSEPAAVDPENVNALAQSLAEQAGWQQAARRLKKLGIRKCRLEPQIEEQRFTFICSLASPDNPRVVRRFEADADDPLEAVQQVLEQIDRWLKRDGSASQTAPVADEN